MSTPIGQKFVLMRESERMNRKVFSEAVGVPYGTIAGYENQGKEPGMAALVKILSHPTFAKYRDWLMFDTTDPAAGQIAPALAHFGQDKTDCSASGKQTG